MRAIQRITVTAGCVLAMLAAVSPARAGSPDPERRIVVYKDAAKAKKAIEAAGGKVVRELPALRAIAAKLSDAGLAKLRGNAAVEFVEADAPRYPLSINAPSPTGPQLAPWGITAVNADPQAYAGGVKICIIDSGYSRGHEDLEKQPGARATPSSTVATTARTWRARSRRSTTRSAWWA
ncbi:MAG: hypothetical protein IPK07_12365 [Deltaproteobacteria bacterium]|nr:hypothetical protein [Deltaproteobacteria bacterium]